MQENPSDELTFEQSLAQLEQIVRDLEDSQLGLDDALARYERGVRLTKTAFRPIADRLIQAKLSTDSEGPLALFEDPCWMESTGKRCR